MALNYEVVMPLVIGAVLGGGSVVGGIVWGIRLEGRLDTAVTRQNDFKELVNTKLDLMNSNVSHRLDRIEKALNGYMASHGGGHGHD